MNNYEKIKVEVFRLEEENKRAIIIPIYYAEIDGKKVVDEDSIREEFERKLKEVI